MSIMEDLAHRSGPRSPQPPGCVDAAPAEQSPADAELIDAVRNGDVGAYGVLYRLHVASARNLARQLTHCSADADDYVAEAFAKVLTTLRAGKGPHSAFRAYLLTTLRRLAYDKTRRDRIYEWAEEISEVIGMRAESVSVAFADTVVAGLERWFAARAFCRLPHRWQAVLWHTEIEGHRPAEVAPAFGLTPNGLAALACRARAGLCIAYLQAQVTASNAAPYCRETVERLGPWTRGELCRRDRSQVETHLAGCATCRDRVRELAANNPRLVRQWGNPTLDHACA